ncbi:MAG: hypothetical protein WC792_05820 [Candidatus Micrarchaeia archaeon]|jgi:hypothetical protein
MAGEKKPRIIGINDAAKTPVEQAEVEAEWARRAVDAAEEEPAEPTPAPQAPPWMVRQEQLVASQITQEPQTPPLPQVPPIESEMQKMVEDVRAKAKEQRELHQREEAIRNPQDPEPGTQDTKPEAQPPQAQPAQSPQPLPAQQSQQPAAPQIIGVEQKRPKIVETRDYSMLLSEKPQPAAALQVQEQEAPKTMKEVVAESALDKFREKQRERSKLSLKNAYYRVAGIFTDIGKKLRGEKER